MKALAKLLCLLVLAPPLLVGLSIGFIGLALGEEEKYR